MTKWGLPSRRQNLAGEHFPCASATGLRCRTLTKHSSLMERDGFARERPTKLGSRMDWPALGSPRSRQLLVLEAAVMDLGAVQAVT